MYCPKCGQEQSSAEVLFCSRCGLGLNVIRTSLAGEHNKALSTTTSPHRDINSGVAIMLLGTLLTSGLVVIADLQPAGAFLVLTLILISVLLSSRHLTRAIHRLLAGEKLLPATAASRKGMCFGALLMYLGTILSTCAATMVTGRLWVPTFFLTLINVFILLLLFSRRLMLTVQDLLTDEETPPDGILPLRATTSLPQVGAFAEAALPPGLGTPMLSLGTQRVSTAEMVPPPSITERTTNLLGNKTAESD